MIITEIVNKTCVITINREEKMNALNAQIIQELGNAVNDAISNKEIWGIIITGAGKKAFVAGADIAEFANYTPQQGSELSQAGHEVFNAIENSPKPIIAAVNGFALGGGCELAMACHIRVCSDNAKVGQPEVNLGIIPGYGGTQRLIDLVGKGKALEMLISTQMLSAADALQWGWATHVVEQDKLLSHSFAILDNIYTKSPLAVAETLRLVQNHFISTHDVYDDEISTFGAIMESFDFKEGTQAFLDKRKASFQDWNTSMEAFEDKDE